MYVRIHCIISQHNVDVYSANADKMYTQSVHSLWVLITPSENEGQKIISL